MKKYFQLKLKFQVSLSMVVYSFISSYQETDARKQHIRVQTRLRNKNILKIQSENKGINKIKY